MHNMELARSTRSAHLLLEFGLEHGLTVQQCLDTTGLTAPMLADPAAEILATQELALIRNLARVLEPDAGLRAGSRYTLEMFGMLGFACLSAPTGRHFVALALRYQDLSFTLAEARFIAANDISRVVIDVSHIPDDARRFVVDHCLAYVWATMKDVCGQVAGIGLACIEPSDSERYQELFGVSAHFGQSSAWIDFRNSDLDRMRAFVDTQASRFCEQACAQLLAQREATIGAVGLVRGRLNRATGGLPSMDMVASDLYMSARSLQRRLAAEGTSFRQLIEEVRRERADRLLANGLQVSHVAHELGYATSAAFVHAYKHWHGATPGSRRVRRRTVWLDTPN